MYFLYTIDEFANEPIMLIDKHIGNYDGEIGIMGDQFARELLYLDGMGKQRIKVWINSIGGAVYDAMAICNAIAKCKTPVDTYNVGIAASAAGLIAQYGRKRYMNDYALLMIHSPFNEDSDEDEALSKFKESCITMLMNKCKNRFGSMFLQERDEVTKMMDGETWLDANECMEAGFCDEVDTNDVQVSLTGITGITDKWLTAAKVLNAAIDKTKKDVKMNKVLNFLDLQEGTNEDAVLKAIQTIKNEAETAKTELETLKAEKEALDVKIADFEAKEAEMKEKEAEAKALEMVNTFKPRIGDNVTKWVNLAKSDFEGTKELLESLPLNVAAAKINDEPAAAPYNMAVEMAKRAQKTN